MARPIPASSPHHLLFSSMPITVSIVVIAVLSIFSVVTFLCGSKRKMKLQPQMEEVEDITSHSKNKRFISKLNNNLSERALSMVKMMSWRKVQTEEEEEEEGNYVDDDSDEAFWRKSILMGERCRPLHFSGKIVYDSEGNMVPDFSDDLSHKNGHH